MASVQTDYGHWRDEIRIFLQMRWGALGEVMSEGQQQRSEKGEGKGKGKGKSSGPMFWCLAGLAAVTTFRENARRWREGWRQNQREGERVLQLRQGRAPGGAMSDTSPKDRVEGGGGRAGDVESVSRGWDIFGLDESVWQQHCHHGRGCPQRRRRWLIG